MTGLIDKKFMPQCTIFLDIDEKTLTQRIKKDGFRNKFDQKYLRNFKKIRSNYLESLKNKSIRRKILILKSNDKIETIHETIISYLHKWKLIK